MSNGDALKLWDVFQTPGVQQSAADTTDHVSNINPRQGEQQAVDNTQINYDIRTGTFNIKGLPGNKAQEVLGKANEYDSIQRIYQQQLADIEAKATYQKAHPFMNTMSQIAAAIAAGDREPAVRSLGHLAQQVNPTELDLRNQRLDVLRQAATYEEAVNRRKEETRYRMLAERRENRLEATGLATQSRQTFHELGVAAQKGELSDVAITSKVLQDAGHSKEVADSQAMLLVGASKEKQRLITEAQTATDKRAKDALLERARESDKRIAAIVAGVGLKASDKKEAEEALDVTARSIAKYELSAIRDIASYRGSDRMKLFARAKQYNPDFNTSELNRRIKTLDSFTQGKDGVALQSFGTFLEHAGEVTETLKKVQLGNVPAFNKPMNWWRKNMAGSPEYQRLLTSLEPVGKEFESFLLNQRALYGDDRKQVDTLLNGNSTPAQILAALGQMGKTAKDRYTEMNHRYKRVMHEDIENPFSPEAIAGANKIGIELGTTPAESSDVWTPEKVRDLRKGQ